MRMGGFRSNERVIVNRARYITSHLNPTVRTREKRGYNLLANQEDFSVLPSLKKSKFSNHYQYVISRCDDENAVALVESFSSSFEQI